jgi:hypothetical protein
MILQLNPPLPVFVSGRGTGLAHLVIDYGPESHLYWVVALDSGGELWMLPNPDVRLQVNQTLGRTP